MQVNIKFVPSRCFGVYRLLHCGLWECRYVKVAVKYLISTPNFPFICVTWILRAPRSGEGAELESKQARALTIDRNNFPAV